MNKYSFLKWLSLVLILATVLSACGGTAQVGPGTTVNGTPVEPGLYVWSFEKATESVTPTGTIVAPTPDALTPTGTPAAPNTGLFGSGNCVINGTTYVLKTDSSAIWMDSETLEALASYGGTCNVDTLKEGWYWSVGDGSITHDGTQMERGNALVANEGTWVFTYTAPLAGTTNESLGLTFRDNLPQVGTSNDAFGTGTCTIDGQNYSVAYDATAVWEDDEALRQLVLNGGTCTVTTVRNGWYWSVAGTITLDGNTMANGQRLVAPAGTYTFVYESGADANGFTIRDNVPFGQ